LAGGQAGVHAATTREQELAGPLVGSLQVIVDGLAGLLAQFKSDGVSGFLLSDGRTIRRVATGGNILDPDGDDVAATKLAVDRQIEHGGSRTRPSIWSFVRIDQTCLGRSGGFAPVSLLLFQGTRLCGIGLAFT
jgi:hypothetical protein